MSRDDSVLIVKVFLKGKAVWLVFHVQAHDNFKSREFILWYISNSKNHNLFVTEDYARAEAQGLEDSNQTEYGMLKVDTNINLDEFNCDEQDNRCIVFHQEYPYPAEFDSSFNVCETVWV